MMNRKLMILTLVAIALAGTTSYASAPSGRDTGQEVWNPDVVADAADPGLVFTPQGSNTYAMIDPACGPCIAAMKAQLRLRAQSTNQAPLSPSSPDALFSEEEKTILDGQQ